jgi:hypothetical protein
MKMLRGQIWSVVVKAVMLWRRWMKLEFLNFQNSTATASCFILLHTKYRVYSSAHSVKLVTVLLFAPVDSLRCVSELKLELRAALGVNSHARLSTNNPTPT